LPKPRTRCATELDILLEDINWRYRSFIIIISIIITQNIVVLCYQDLHPKIVTKQ